MIKAEHKWWARIIFNPYVDHLLKKSFKSFYLLNDLPAIDKSAGLILTPNHFSWWDGFISDFVTRKLIKRKIHVMMLEEQLKRYWFFKKVGAYSINPANPVNMVKTFNYSRNIVTSPENLIVLFPQGEIQSMNSKTISIKEGLEVLLGNFEAEIFVLPLAVKFEYGENRCPNIIGRFGKLLKGSEIKADFKLFKTEFINNIEILRTVTILEGCKNILR